MSRGLIAFIIVACIAIASVMIIYMRWSADNARKRSDDILNEFKTVDKDLKESNSKIDSGNKVILDSLYKKLK